MDSSRNSFLWYYSRLAVDEACTDRRIVMEYFIATVIIVYTLMFLWAIADGG